MTPVLAIDTMLSVLAGAGLLVLRRALATADLTDWLRTSLRFGALVLAVFYILRPAAWIWAGSFIDRLILFSAALAPLAVLLISEAVVRRHAPPALKLACLIGTLVFALGALVFPRGFSGMYLTGLLAFQIAVLSACALMLWRDSRVIAVADRKVVRSFAILVLIALPVMSLESAALSGVGHLHLSALVLLLGVWLLFERSLWVSDPWRLGLWFASLGGLAAVIAAVLASISEGPSMLALAALVFTLLLFASLVAADIRRTSSALEDRLFALISESRKRFTSDHILEELTHYQIVTVPAEFVSDADTPKVLARLDVAPVWSRDGQSVAEDADLALYDIAIKVKATHLFALQHSPLQLVGLSIGPSETSKRLLPLLTALARRLEGQGTHV